MKKLLVGSVVLGVLLAALAVGTAWAGHQGEQNAPVATQTQTRTDDQNGECPAEPARIRQQVERELGRGHQGRMLRTQRQAFQQ